MTASSKDFWNARYSIGTFAYGEVPNLFFEEKIRKLQIGKILLPAEGEGRNAVFAARVGWDVSAFDISNEGKNKALALAQKHNVAIDYRVGELSDLHYNNEEFDALALIYAHFAPQIKAAIHIDLNKLLKKGGTVILEAFSKNNLNYSTKNPNVGGPKNADMLYSTEEIREYFTNFEIVELAETEITLNEGLFHNGQASVIRFVGKKK